MQLITRQAHINELTRPALCKLLPVRDYLDNVMVRTNGAFVAGYRLNGINSYYHSDAGRNRAKESLEALVRALPEQSMRMQFRFEVVEGTGDLGERYQRMLTNPDPTVTAIDRTRLAHWASKDEQGYFLRHILHAYFVWDPRVHRLATSPDSTPWQRWSALSGTGVGFSLSVDKCIQRARRDHDDLVAEFESILSGVEQTLAATGMGPLRLNADEMFVELKRSMDPLSADAAPLRRPEHQLKYASARAQATNTAIEFENESCLEIGGLLYSFVSLKDLPDATFPGMLRQLLVLDFPVSVAVDVTIPDQARKIDYYKGRLRRMQAAQRDVNGGYRINVDAQVAQAQLIETLQNLVSSSLKTSQLSLVVAVRTSERAVSRRDLDEQQRVLADRRNRVLHALGRMNGARGHLESLAKRRLWVAGLPGCAEDTRREMDCLSPHAADLLPVETPWHGTPNTPLVLLETPYRQLLPFSLFDSSLPNANVLITAGSGGGKTFLAQLLLLQAARIRPLISILERGDSYRPLVDLMGGRSIDVDLEGRETLNPWDLAEGQTEPSRDKVAFLMNLTKHMIGLSRAEDTSLVDTVLSDAIDRTYRRCRARYSQPTPTYLDLLEELQHWRDPQSVQQLEDTAKITSTKLREWTGESGVYAKLFDRPTTMRTNSDWLFFNVEHLSSDPKLEIAMSMVIAHAMSERASGKTGQPNITVLDECWSLLASPVLAPEVVQLFRTARKRNASVWGISQSLEDFVGTRTNPRPHGATIVANVGTKIVGQQPGDVTPLIEHLGLNETAVNEVKRFAAPKKGRFAEALLVLGEKADTTQTVRVVPTPIEYWICTTFPRERLFRAHALAQRSYRPLIDIFTQLATRFPSGLADVPELPEEIAQAFEMPRAKPEALAAAGARRRE